MKLSINKTKLKRNIGKYFVLLLANFILVIATVIFYNGFGIVAGGVSGIAIIFDHFFEGYLDITAYIITGVLLIASFFTLGKKVTLKSLFSTLMYPVLLTIVFRILNVYSFDEWFLNNIVNVTINNETSINMMNYFLCSLFGGLLSGFAVGLAFLVGGTTGGFDILVLIIKKYFNRANESVITFIIDGSIILCGILVFGFTNTNNAAYLFSSSLLNILSALVCAITIQVVYITRNNSISCEIISSKWNELNDYFLNVLERGTTIYNVEGGYKFEKRKLIRVVVHKKEYENVLEKIKEIDDKAFCTFTFTKQVIGNGFSINNPYD